MSQASLATAPGVDLVPKNVKKTQILTRVEKRQVSESSSEDSPERRGAALLLAVAAIATKEIKVNRSALWSDEEAPSTRVYTRISGDGNDSDNYSSGSSSDEDQPMSKQELFNWNRIRTVSIDHHDDVRRHTSPLHYKGKAALVSPGNSPLARARKPTLKIRGDSPVMHSRIAIAKTKHTHRPKAESSLVSGDKNNKRPLQALPRGNPVKTILRKKFSWKNAPELEAFLIANREEYLRHSALNYTVQQKQYNNRLTERLLDLAAEHGYVFDEDAFSFVTVRDRIRCYFKSYVQSAKKRGVIIGYAARKAGLLTPDELSAGGKGRIVLPSL